LLSLYYSCVVPPGSAFSGLGWSPLPLLGVAHRVPFPCFFVFGLVGPFGRPSCFFPRPSGLNLIGFVFTMSGARTFPCTVSVDVSGLASQGLSRLDVVSAIVDQFRGMPIAAVQFFGTVAKVTFEHQGDKRSVMQHQSVCIRGVDCDIRGGGPRPQNVLIYNFPFEIEHDVVKTAFSFFGDVEYVRFRHWTHLVDVCDGVRTVRMVRTRAIPRNLVIDGFPVKVSYVGQEPECDICGKKGHIAKNCDMRGKCMECKQPGHFQRDCPERRRRLSRSVLDLPENSESVPVDSAPAGLPAGTPGGAVLSSAPADGAGPLVDNAAPVVENDASSQAVSQSILATVSGPPGGAPPVLGESVDSRDNQLDELASSGSIGVVSNYSDSLFGAVVSTPNSNLSVVAGDQPPNSNLIVVNANESSDNVNSKSLKNGNNDISNDIVDNNVSDVQLQMQSNDISSDIVNSDLNDNEDNNVSDLELQMQSSNDISSVDDDEINENNYETSSEGVSTDGEISDDDSEQEAGDIPPSGGNLVSPGSSDLSTPLEQRRKVARIGGADARGSSSGARVPRVSGGGVQKPSAPRSSGISDSAKKSGLAWSVSIQRRT